MQRKFSYTKYWYWRMYFTVRNATEPHGLFLLALFMTALTIVTWYFRWKY
jgi:hypothetical protein